RLEQLKCLRRMLVADGEAPTTDHHSRFADLVPRHARKPGCVAVQLAHHEVEALVQGEEDLTGRGRHQRRRGEARELPAGRPGDELLNPVLLVVGERLLRLLDEDGDRVGAVVLLDCGRERANVPAGDAEKWPAAPGRGELPVVRHGHHTFPAPGVYGGETPATLAIIVVQLITPSKFATGAWTFIPEAVTSTATLARIFTLPAASIVMLQPLEWLIFTSCAPSSIVSLWPLFMESVTRAAPSVS